MKKILDFTERIKSEVNACASKIRPLQNTPFWGDSAIYRACYTFGFRTKCGISIGMGIESSI